MLLAPSWRQPPESLQIWFQHLARGGWRPRAAPRGMGSAERELDSFRRSAAGADVIGGQSFGARVASLAAALEDCRARGLILISFPLSGQGERRCAHWGLIRCPVLLISGSEDPLAPIPELRRRARALTDAHLRVIAGGGHDLRPRAAEVMAEVLPFLGVVLRSGGSGAAPKDFPDAAPPIP